MDCDPQGKLSRVPAEQRLNVYALVIYIPDPLGEFLDDLRRELIPGCNPHAHVSVLPPRPLAVDWQVAGDQLRALTGSWAPFQIEPAGVQVFPVTDVIYLEVGSGAMDLYRLHDAMNADALEFQEPFVYHPHITLAQEIPHQEVPAARDLARRRWKEYRGKRAFRADRAAFVQNTLHDCWIDLAEFSLGAVTVP